MKHLLLAVFFLFTLATTASAQVRVNAAALADRVEIRVYPNPADTYIQLSDNEQVQTIAVFNQLGRRIKEFPYIKGENFYVGDLPRGMYLVQLIDNRAKVITTQRINKR